MKSTPENNASPPRRDDVDELRPEYELNELQLRRVGPGRQPVVQLAPDVAKIFPDSQAVNEALRFLIRMARPDNAEPQRA